MRYIEMALNGDRCARDLGMFENLAWHRARWPKGTKTIVWCATSHAAKGVLPGSSVRPLGSFLKAELKKRVVSIGFGASAGAFSGPGGRGKVTELAPPAEGSLEVKAFAADERSPLRYLDRKALMGFGSVAARAVSYEKPLSLDWSTVLDGIVVLREERAVEPPR